MRLSGWGNLPVIETRLATWRDPEEAADLVRGQPSLIARGNGRAYGDSALNRECVLSALGSDRILELDLERGRIRCEAGLLLSDLLAVLIPRGWFVPVTPGTRYVTIGGMVASDVHGKNHHRDGTFCRWVEALRLVTADGSVIDCSRDRHAGLFHATCGGMGLTGVVVEVEFRLVPIETAGIVQEVRRAANLDEIMPALEEAGHWQYSVAWIDCLATGRSRGRSILLLGRHAGAGELPGGGGALALGGWREGGRRLAVPFYLPGFALNRFSLRAFNACYYARGALTARRSLVPLAPFFYPLDGVAGWNRLYGRRGFVQYQCVLPRAESRRGIARLLDRIADAGLGSFLAVLKLLGEPSCGYLSFPLPGYTLALDFPWVGRTPGLLIELDRIVRDHGGRLYLTKDSRMPPEMLDGAYPELARFRQVKARIDPDNRFRSLQSSRLGL